MKDTELRNVQNDREKDISVHVPHPQSDRHEPETREVSENWAEETIADLDDFIESQGIYIRQ